MSGWEAIANDNFRLGFEEGRKAERDRIVAAVREGARRAGPVAVYWRNAADFIESLPPSEEEKDAG